ncbi:MAG: hypothetical protein QXT80_03915 [Thermoplasmatales archaeon]
MKKIEKSLKKLKTNKKLEVKKMDRYCSMKNVIEMIKNGNQLGKYYRAEGMFMSIVKHEKEEKLYSAQDVLDLLLELEDTTTLERA